MGAIDLAQCRELRACETETNILNSFVLVMGSRSYYLYAETFRERHDWMMALQAAIDVAVRLCANGHNGGESRCRSGLLTVQAMFGLGRGSVTAA